MEKATINLNTRALIKYCSNGSIPDKDILYKLKMINRRNESNVHNVFGYRKFNDDFVDQVTVYCSDDGTSTIKFSYDNFLLKLFIYHIYTRPRSFIKNSFNRSFIFNFKRSIIK